MMDATSYRQLDRMLKIVYNARNLGKGGKWMYYDMLTQFIVCTDPADGGAGLPCRSAPICS
jgi:hypothetical protein